MITETTVLAGVREIAAHFQIQPNVVGNWIARYPDFPEAVADLAMGRVWDLNEVVMWYNDRWATEVDDPGEVDFASQ